MLKSETKTINGTKYKVTQLPFGLGHVLLLRLYQTLGPALAAGFEKTPSIDKNTLGDLEISKIAPLLAAVVSRLAQDLSDSDFDHMVETLGQYSFIIDAKGVESQLSRNKREFHFAGNYGEFFQWLVFALRVNYLNFSNGRDLLTGMLARFQSIAEQYESQSGSTGPCTE